MLSEIFSALARMKKMEQETEFARIHQIGLPAILVTETGSRGKTESQVSTVDHIDVDADADAGGSDHVFDRRAEDEEGKASVL